MVGTNVKDTRVEGKDWFEVKRNIQEGSVLISLYTKGRSCCDGN